MQGPTGWRPGRPRHHARLATLTPLLVVLLLPAPTFAQLPFGVTESDILTVDTAAVEWLTVKTHVGGAKARLSYSAEVPTIGECKAATVIGALRLRDHYIQKRGLEPVTFRLISTAGAPTVGTSCMMES